MTEATDSLVLEHLRHIRASVDSLREDMREVKGRLTGVEAGLAAVRRDMGALAEADARIQGQLDRLSDRAERIEKRLGLIEA